MGIWKQKGTKGPSKNGTTLAHSVFVLMKFLSNFSVTMVEPSYQSKCTNDTGRTILWLWDFLRRTRNVKWYGLGSCQKHCSSGWWLEGFSCVAFIKINTLLQGFGKSQLLILNLSFVDLIVVRKTSRNMSFSVAVRATKRVQLSLGDYVVTWFTLQALSGALRKARNDEISQIRLVHTGWHECNRYDIAIKAKVCASSTTSFGQVRALADPHHPICQLFFGALLSSTMLNSRQSHDTFGTGNMYL